MSDEKQIESDLIPTAVKIPRALHARIEALAPYCRGGKSEVMRKALTAGLPIVIAQRSIRIPTEKEGQ